MRFFFFKNWHSVRDIFCKERPQLWNRLARLCPAQTSEYQGHLCSQLQLVWANYCTRVSHTKNRTHKYKLRKCTSNSKDIFHKQDFISKCMFRRGTYLTQVAQKKKDPFKSFSGGSLTFFLTLNIIETGSGLLKLTVHVDVHRGGSWPREVSVSGLARQFCSKKFSFYVMKCDFVTDRSVT